MPPSTVKISKERFLCELGEEIALVIKKSGKIENRKINFLIPQLEFWAKNKEKTLRNRKEAKRKKVKLLGIIIFLFFKQSISQAKKSKGIIILTEAKSKPSAGLRAI
ncbi:MAG: hypothetical protein WAV16_01880 [Candidatus Moraniibacteriota bacterium]